MNTAIEALAMMVICRSVRGDTTCTMSLAICAPQTCTQPSTQPMLAASTMTMARPSIHSPPTRYSSVNQPSCGLALTTSRPLAASATSVSSA